MPPPRSWLDFHGGSSGVDPRLSRPGQIPGCFPDWVPPKSEKKKRLNPSRRAAKAKKSGDKIPQNLLAVTSVTGYDRIQDYLNVCKKFPHSIHYIVERKGYSKAVESRDRKDSHSSDADFAVVGGEPLDRKTEYTDGFVEPGKSAKEHEIFEYSLSLLRGMLFKADKPYRTKIGFHTNFTTNGSGVLNFTVAPSSIGSSAVEWSSLIALFDEVFIHSVSLRFKPFNTSTGGYSSAMAPTQGTWTTPTGSPWTFTGTQGYVNSVGLIAASIFGGSGSYSSASQMVANPNHKLIDSWKDWKYVWRNNVRFDPRGLQLTPAATIGWQGWTTAASVADYGGLMQIRAIGDQVIGDGAHTWFLGNCEIVWDVSFRVRA
jgi:hypothetical protein